MYRSPVTVVVIDMDFSAFSGIVKLFATLNSSVLLLLSYQSLVLVSASEYVWSTSSGHEEGIYSWTNCHWAKPEKDDASFHRNISLTNLLIFDVPISSGTVRLFTTPKCSRLCRSLSRTKNITLLMTLTASLEAKPRVRLKMWWLQ